ncbi:hypothetical protein ACVWZ3_000584 [Bradyrhizobium sp. i1.3.6]
MLGDLVQRFIDIPKRDGQKLFDLFQSHITAPENPVRWSWKEGDSRFGITAQRSIMRSTITVTSIASSIVPQSMV